MRFTFAYRSLFRLPVLVLLLSLFARPDSAQADWRDDLGTFRIGIVTGADPSAVISRVEPFRLAVQEALGMPVEIYPSGDLAVLANAHSQGRVEYAILTASAFAAAWAGCECVEPLVTARSGDGGDFYRAIVLAPRNGKINDPSQLTGARVIGLSENSVAGHAFPLFELSVSGITAPGSVKVAFASSSEEAMLLYAGGEADALLGWSSMTGDPSDGYSRGTLRVLAERGLVNLTDHRVVWQSSPIPHRTHSIRKNLAGEAKAILRKLLVDLYQSDPVSYDSIEPVFGGGFAAARFENYSGMIDFVRSPFYGIDGTGRPEPQEKQEPAASGTGQLDSRSSADTGTPDSGTDPNVVTGSSN